MKKLTSIVLLGGLFLSSNTVFACDDKSCETAYLNSSKQYVGLHSSQALAAQKERIAYAKVRENRQKKVNEQLVREARARWLLIINKAIAEGKSVEYIELAIRDAYNSGAIKAQPIPLDVDTNQTASVETTEAIDTPQNS